MSEQTTPRRRHKTAKDILSDPLLEALANADVAELSKRFEEAHDQVQEMLRRLYA